MDDEIWYCHVRSDSKQLTPGHWFFHRGQWAQCANAYYLRRPGGSTWVLDLNFERGDKPLPSLRVELSSLPACKNWLAEYFECEVVKVGAWQMLSTLENEL